MKKLLTLFFAMFVFGAVLYAQTTITIGTQVVQSGTSAIGPTNYYWESRRIQWVMTAAEILAAGGNAGTITSLAFDVSQIATGNLLNYEIKMAETAAVDAATHNTATLTTVVNAHTFLPGAMGWRTIPFNTNFTWNGTSNILFDVCWGVNAGYASNGQVWLYNNVANQMRGVFSGSVNQCGVATTATRLGKPRMQLTIAPVSLAQMDWYNLQWPPTGNIDASQNLTVYAQGWEPGVTEAPGPGTGVSCWIGYSTTNTNPNTWTNWVPATFNVQVGNNDEFMANIGNAQSLAPGTYYYASRWQLSGGPMTYGGYNTGSGDGAWDGTNDISGVLTITPYYPPLTYTQNFPVATFAPYWTQTYSGGVTSNRWTVTNTAIAGGTPYEMTCTYVSGVGISRLISPGLVFAGTTDLWLSFKTMYNDFGVGVTLRIQTSTDLINWTDAWTYAGGSGDIPATTINVDLANTGTTPTYVAWVVDGDHYQIDYWYIDDVVVQDGPFITPGLWKGTLSNDWFTGGNWDDGLVPVAATNVTIPAGCPNYPSISTPGGVCNNMNIQAGGNFYMIDSFFDVFMDISCAGNLDISGGTLNNGGYLFVPNATSTFTMSNGVLNTDGIFQNAAYTWSPGVFTLSGGTINQVGTAFFYGGTAGASTMSGNFVYNVGGTLQLDNTKWTLTGGTINLLGTETVLNYFLPPLSTGTSLAYNLNINAGNNAYIFVRDATFNNVSILNDLSIQSGSVNLLNVTGNVGTFSVGGDLDVAANGYANLSIPAASVVNIAGNVNQALVAGTGYGSIMGPANIGGTYNFNVSIPGLTGGKWELISAPVSNATAGMFLCQYLMRHDPITNTWIDIVEPTTPLDPGVDYALWVHPDAIINNASQVCPVIDPLTSWTWSGTRNAWASLTVPVLTGWNNVGNPYSATIDWTLAGWDKSAVNDAIYFENSGTWSGYVGGVPYNGGSQYIAPTQGFFVESESGGNFGFAPATATHTRTTFYKSDISNLLRLVASGNGRTDETVIRILDVATTGFDKMYDAHKMFNNAVEYPQVPQFYSMDNGYMAVNAIDGGEMVALGFRAGMPGVYTISQTEANDFSHVVLEDLATGTFTDLLAGDYTFQYNTGDNEGRFIVHFTPLATGDNLAENLNIYAYGHAAYVNVPENSKGMIQVFNVMGQEVASAPLNNTLNNVSIPQSGSYIVKVTTNEKVYTQKINIQ